MANILQDQIEKLKNPEKAKLKDELNALSNKLAINSFLPDDVKSQLRGFCDTLRLDSVTSLPSQYLQNMSALVKEISGKIPLTENNILPETKSEISSLLSSSLKEFESTANAMKAMSAITEKSDREKEKDNVVETLRFTGIDVVKNGDEYEIAISNTGLARCPLGDKAAQGIADNALKNLNSNNLIALLNKKDYMSAFKKTYANTLKKSGLDDRTVSNATEKYDVNSPEFQHFVLTDNYLKKQIILDYFKNQFSAVVCKDSFETIKDNEEFPALEGISDNITAKYSQSVLACNNILTKYEDLLKDLPDNSQEKEDIERVVDQLSALSQICDKHKDIILKCEKGVEDFLNHIEVDYSKKADPFFLESPISGLDDKDIALVNDTLSNLEIISIKNLKRSNDIDAKQANTSAPSQAQPTKTTQRKNGPTNDMPLLKIIREIALDKKISDAEKGPILGIFNLMKEDTLLYNLSKIDFDKTELTVAEWEEILDCDLISAMGTNTPEAATIEEHKKNGEKFKLSTNELAQLKTLVTPEKEKETLNGYAALLRLKERYPNKKIEYLSVEDINKELKSIQDDITKNPITDAEKAKAEKLRNKFRYLNAKDGQKESSTDVKKIYDQILDGEDFEKEKDQLDKEYVEEPEALLEEENSDSKENGSDSKYITFAERYAIKDTESLAKKLKGYNTKYLTKLIDDIIKTIKKTKVLAPEEKKTPPPNPTTTNKGSDKGTDEPIKQGDHEKDGVDEQPEADEEEIEEASEGESGEDKPEEEKEKPAEIDTMIEWFKKHKESVLESAEKTSLENADLDKFTDMFGTLFKLMEKNSEKFNTVLANMFNVKDGDPSTPIRNINDKAWGNIVGPGVSFGEIKKSLVEYFQGKDGKSQAYEDFKEYIYAGEDFIIDGNVDCAKMLIENLMKAKQNIKETREQYYDKVITELESLKEQLGPEEAMEIIGQLAVMNPTKLTMGSGEKVSEIVQFKKQISENEKLKDFNFDNLLSMNPQILLEVICSFPNHISGNNPSKIQSEAETTQYVSTAMFSQDYNIKENIDVLVTVVGQEKAKKYVDMLLNTEDEKSRQQVVEYLNQVVKLPLDHLNNADTKLLKNLIAQNAIELYSQNEEQVVVEKEDGMEP